MYNIKSKNKNINKRWSKLEINIIQINESKILRQIITITPTSYTQWPGLATTPSINPKVELKIAPLNGK